jgi:GNAT superfamily N-acetyltransferase
VHLAEVGQLPEMPNYNGRHGDFEGPVGAGSRSESTGEDAGVALARHMFEEHLKELDSALSLGMTSTLPMAILVAHDEDGALIGFLEVGMRSHADGCNPARPVGFVEGWFVQETFRNRGVGRELMRVAEEWARAHGCLEMASDTWIDNIDGSAHAQFLFKMNQGERVLRQTLRFRFAPLGDSCNR